VAMLAKFWGNLQVHELRSSRDPLDQKTLLVYQAEQRRLWHLAITSPRGAYNLSRINEEIMKKTREKVYWDDRRVKDYERDFRSDQRSADHSSSQRRPPSQFRRRSLSPVRPFSIRKTSPPDVKPSITPQRMDFQAGAGGRVYSACAVCLGRHPHRIVECEAKMLWDSSHPSLAIRSNKILAMRDGRPICGDWQRVSSCPSSRHDNRHICSGCASSSHGAQNCSRAQKIPGSHSL